MRSRWDDMDRDTTIKSGMGSKNATAVSKGMCCEMWLSLEVHLEERLTDDDTLTARSVRHATWSSTRYQGGKRWEN